MFSFQWGIQVRGEILFTGRFYQGLVHDLFFEYLKAKEKAMMQGYLKYLSMQGTAW